MQTDIRDIPVYCIKSTNIFDNQIDSLKEYNFQNIYTIKNDCKKNTSLTEQLNQSIQYKLALEYIINQGINTPFILLENNANLFNENFAIEYPDHSDAIYLGIFRYGFDNVQINYNESPGTNTLIAKYITEYKIYQIYNMLSMYAILYNNHNFLLKTYNAISFMNEKSIHGSRGLATIMKYYNVYAIPYPIFYNKAIEKDTKILMDDCNMRDLFF